MYTSFTISVKLFCFTKAVTQGVCVCICTHTHTYIQFRKYKTVKNNDNNNEIRVEVEMPGLLALSNFSKKLECGGWGGVTTAYSICCLKCEILCQVLKRLKFLSFTDSPNLLKWTFKIILSYQNLTNLQLSAIYLIKEDGPSPLFKYVNVFIILRKKVGSKCRLSCYCFCCV